MELITDHLILKDGKLYTIKKYDRLLTARELYDYTCHYVVHFDVNKWLKLVFNLCVCDFGFFVNDEGVKTYILSYMVKTLPATTFHRVIVGMMEYCNLNNSAILCAATPNVKVAFDHLVLPSVAKYHATRELVRIFGRRAREIIRLREEKFKMYGKNLVVGK